MPHRHGGHKFGTPITGDPATMPEVFNDLGYTTAHFGKFHHMPRGKFPYAVEGKKDVSAVDFLTDYDDERPFLLVVCSHYPHLPWNKNEAYDPAEIELPPKFVDTPETRAEMCDYYTDVSLMDGVLGQVLDALDRGGMADNTMVAYTSDQGANWPFAKWCLYDAGLRVPLIVRWPGQVEAGSVSDAMLSLADLLPTFAEIAGGKAPAGIDGRSFVGALNGTTQEHREVVFGTHTGNDNGGPGIANQCPTRSIRTRTHQYILNLEHQRTFTTHITGCKPGNQFHQPHWDSWVERAKIDKKAAFLVHAYQHRPPEELYDVANDPHEMNNLADNPEYADLLKSVRKQLADWREQQGDTVNTER